MTRGKLEVFYGNMFSNKTGTLIHKIETLRNYGKKLGGEANRGI